MKARFITQESPGFFSKLWACCFFQNDSEEDKEIDWQDIFGDFENTTEIKINNPSVLFQAIKEDLVRINDYLDYAFNNKFASGYLAYNRWFEYLNKHEFLFSNDGSFFIPAEIEAIPDVELLRLIAGERTILDKFLAQEEVNMSQKLSLFKQSRNPGDKRIYHKEINKVQNIKMATDEFTYHLETAYDLIQRCNNKINYFRELMRKNINLEKESVACHLEIHSNKP